MRPNLNCQCCLSTIHLLVICSWLLSNFSTSARKHCSISCLATRVLCGSYYSMKDMHNISNKGHGRTWEKVVSGETLTLSSHRPTSLGVLMLQKLKITKL